MEISVNIAVLAGALGGGAALVWLIRRLTAPRVGDGDTALYLAAAVGGQGGQLQQTVSYLEKLRQDSGLPMELVIIDTGLEPEGRRIAEIEARRRGITLCRGKDIFNE